MPLLAMAMSLGCHVRVGMEDNIYSARGVLAEGNAQFVERMVSLAKSLRMAGCYTCPGPRIDWSTIRAKAVLSWNVNLLGDLTSA